MARSVCAHCATTLAIPKGTYNWQHESTGLTRCPGLLTFAREDKGAAPPPKKKEAGEPWPDAPTNAEIRSWAKLNGWPIGDRGRISLEIRQAFAEDADT